MGPCSLVSHFRAALHGNCGTHWVYLGFNWHQLPSSGLNWDQLGSLESIGPLTFKWARLGTIGINRVKWHLAAYVLASLRSEAGCPVW